MHLVATVFPQRREVLLTGSIDTNDFNINVKMELPDKGVWTIIKAETNLTKESWTSWVMRLGQGMKIPSDKTNQLLYSRQFNDAQYFSEYNAIVFGNGEVRPGEPVLKIYTVELESNVYTLSHGSRTGGGGYSLEQIIKSDVQKKIAAQEDVIIPVINGEIGSIMVNSFKI